MYKKYEKAYIDGSFYSLVSLDTIKGMESDSIPLKRINHVVGLFLENVCAIRGHYAGKMTILNLELLMINFIIIGTIR